MFKYLGYIYDYRLVTLGKWYVNLTEYVGQGDFLYLCVFQSSLLYLRRTFFEKLLYLFEVNKKKVLI